jgi:protein-tyrosine kinase
LGMSKIEKALERAKKMREGGYHEIKALERPAEVSGLDAREPVYTQTRVVPLNESHLEKQRVVTFPDNPEVMDHYNLLRTQVLHRTRDKGHNTLMVTSVVDGEGKTVTAINLAVSMSKEVNQTVMLVDTDLRHPKIHSYLGCSAEKGLSDYLQDDVPVSDLLVNPGLAKMVVLPAGKPLFGSTEILGSPKMEKLVAEMKRRYPERYVIFDCPPVLTVPDALVFASYVDGVILVVEAGRTTKDQIRKAVELLEDRNIVGLVMNKADSSSYGCYY